MTQTPPSPVAQQPAGPAPVTQPSPAPQATAVETLLAMDRRLAGLTAAVEGFAARQQELHARDYAPELAAIQEKWERAREAFDHLRKMPALELTPEMLASQIEQAGASLREADHGAFNHARRDLREAVGTIGSVVTSARTSRDQNHWLAIAAAAAMVLGFAFGVVIPAAIYNSVPTSWHWPERRAANMLGLDEWSAGERLTQVADPDRWRKVDAAWRLYDANADALALCAKQAARAHAARSCTIAVAPVRHADQGAASDR